MTKAERKEAARLERLEIERRMQRQRKVRWISVFVAIVASIALVAVIVATQSRQTSAGDDPDDLIRRASAAATEAGCDEASNVGPYQPEGQDQSHIGQGGVTTMPGFETYPSVPPASGPHAGSPLPAGVYDSPPPMDQVIHSLEHGAVAIWYDPSARSGPLNELRDYFRGGGDPQSGAKVIVAPFDYPDEGEAGRLPGGTQMALVAWHHIQTCAQPSLPVAYDFVAKYRTPPSSGEDYLGEAPEPNAGI